jgi:uncharacterized protein YdaU (DUF1376 family)
MKDTFYFQHDYDARQDKKIVRLMAKHGMRGYGIFWAIIENLYSNANALQTDYESIAFLLHEQSDIVESVINDFGLFVFEGDVFGSTSIEARLNERNEKSGKARESANKRWQKYREENANALRTQSEGNAIKERKGKETKENEIDIHTPVSISQDSLNTEKKKKDVAAAPQPFDFRKGLIDAGGNETLVNDWMLVRKNLKATNTETALKGFLRNVNKSGHTLDAILTVCVERSWKGFEWHWKLPIEEQPAPTITKETLFAD